MSEDISADIVLRSGPGAALTEGTLVAGGYEVRLKHALPDSSFSVSVRDDDGLLGLHRYRLVGLLPEVDVVDKTGDTVGAGSLEDCYQAAILASCDRCGVDIVRLLREEV